MTTKKTAQKGVPATIDLSEFSEAARDQVAALLVQISGQADIQKTQDRHRARLECIRMASDIIQENNRNQLAPSSGGPTITPEDLIEFADKLVKYINGPEAE